MDILEKYFAVRHLTEEICRPLITEDYVVQSMPDASPAKWHLAHTTWFFETFILSCFNWYKPFNSLYKYLFNSYYVQVGERFERSKRGLLSRPSVEEIYDYRKYVNENIKKIFSVVNNEEFSFLMELGINHEQQHQELIVTDIKHMFSQNPLNPGLSKLESKKTKTPSLNWVNFKEGIYSIGSDEGSFVFDNETPIHKEYLESFQLASRPVTNKEYLQFITDGGYDNQILWLSDGWAAKEENKWNAPLYWSKKEDTWFYYTLNGFKEINPDEPVCHISFYEADAFASWSEARLPTEFEWEVASSKIHIEGNFIESKLFHPSQYLLNKNENSLIQMFGDVWEWTRSSYSPYPGYRPLKGALGEYNGKFMSNQFVLRGGSCATPESHIRKTYRNFFPPSARWQFSGIRLAKNKS